MLLTSVIWFQYIKKLKSNYAGYIPKCNFDANTIFLI